MEQLEEVWSGVREGESLACSIPVHVSQVFVYPADHAAYLYWTQQGVEGPVLCQDCLLVDNQGGGLRVMVHPLKRPLALLEQSFIRIKNVDKVSRGQRNILVMTDWEPCQEFQLLYRGELKLSGYADQSRPLSNTWSDLVCPWTCSQFLWSKPAQLMKKSVLSQIKSIAKFNLHYNNLKTLDRTRAPMDLVVRVLAKCKEILILTQAKQRKGWMCVCNLLVADNTAYAVMTVWDEAVSAFHSTVKEGDMLVLQQGSYKATSLRENHRALMHNMAPKVGGAGFNLSATEFEIKVNPPDLDRVWLLASGAICDFVPPLITNFKTSNELVRASAGRLVDVVGMVMFHGRWERGFYQVGRHWVRVWLRVLDHASDDLVSISVFPDVESWQELEKAVPGEVALLTNLQVKVNETGAFSHLESTNQTGVFTAENALNSRFLSFPVVTDFKASLDSNLERWRRAWRERGALGGQFSAGPSVLENLTPLDSEQNSIGTRDHLSQKMEAMEVKSSRRILLNGRVSGAKLMKVSQAGDLVEVKTLLEEDSPECPLIGPQLPSAESFSKVVDRLDKDQSLISVKYFCFLNLGLDVKSPDTVSYNESQFGLVTLLLADAKVNCIVEEKILGRVCDSVSEHFMIDMFKPSFSPSEVEFVLRQVAVLDQTNITLVEDEDEDEGPDTTLELASVFK